MNLHFVRKSRLRIYLYVLAGLVVLLGSGAFYVFVAMNSYKKNLLEPAPPIAAQPLPEFVVDPEEELRLLHVKWHFDFRGKPAIPPTVDSQMQIDPKLLEAIPEGSPYTPVPLREAPVNYTEAQFQKEREEWYSKYFVSEYQRAGQSDPKWDDAAIAFLQEAGKRVAVTRFRRLRHPRFYHDKFEDNLAASGQAILDLGCKDLLIRALLVEELHNQGKHQEANAVADLLNREFGNSKYAQFVQYQVAKSMIGAFATDKSLDRYARHYLKSLASQTFTDLERRILYEEGLDIINPSHASALPEFALSLEFQSNVDPWLRNMVLGDFYSAIGGDGSLLHQCWRMYLTTLQENTALACSVHLNHMKRAYRYYLTAYQAQPDLPDTALRLKAFCRDQHFGAVVPFPLQLEARILPRMCQVDQRYWFDKAISLQFDYLPIYYEEPTLYGSSPADEIEAHYAGIMVLGRECLDSARFETAVPLRFYDAVNSHVRYNEFTDMQGSAHNRLVYSEKSRIEPFERLIAGYTGHLAERELNYFRSLLIGMHWLQGDREQAIKGFVALGNKVRDAAFQEMSLDLVDILRAVHERTPPPPAITNIAKMDLVAPIPESKKLLFFSGVNLGVWDTEQSRFTGKHLFGSPSDGLQRSHFSDGFRYASLSAPPKLQICDTKTLKPVAELTLPDQLVNHRLSRSGKLLAAFDGQKLEIWDVVEKKVQQTIPLNEIESVAELMARYTALGAGPELLVRGFTFSEGDRSLAFIIGAFYEQYADNVDWFNFKHINRLIVWDLENKRCVYNDEPFFPSIRSVRFAESGSELMVTGAEWKKLSFDENPYYQTFALNAIKKFDPANPADVQEYIGHRAPLWSPAEFGTDKSWIVAASGREFLIWDAKTGDEITSVYPLDDEIKLFTAGREANQIVSVDTGGRMNVYEEDFQKGVRPILIAPDFYVHSSTRQIIIDTASRQLALRSQDTGGHLWHFDEKNHALGHTVTEPGPFQTTAHAYSSDLKWLATTPIEQRLSTGQTSQPLPEIKIWSVDSPSVTRTLSGCTANVVCAQFSHDGRVLAAGLSDGNLMLWDLKSDSPEPSNIYHEHKAAIQSMKFSADNRLLVTGGKYGESLGKPFPPSVHIWKFDSESAQLEPFKTLEFTGDTLQNAGVQSVDISADGSAILASCAQETAFFTLDGKRKATVAGYLSALSPDATHFVSTSIKAGNTNFALWQQDGTGVREFRGGHRHPINALAFTADGSAILSGSAGEGLAAWSTETANRLLYVSDIFKSK